MISNTTETKDIASEIAAQTAAMLLDIEAVKLNVENPFTWASGWKSPIYCDNRTVLSFPESRQLVKAHFAKLISSVWPDADCIAGVATAGIAHGILVAEALDLPYVYVRSEPKAHGMGNQIEGRLKPNAKIVVIEDLVSTGGSSLAAVKALRDAGATIEGLSAIFSYGFDKAHNAFEEANCPWLTLSDYANLLPQAVNKGLIKSTDLDILKAWRANPETWIG